MAEPGDAAGAPPPRVGAWVPVLVEQMVNDTLVVTLSCGERRFTGVLLDCSKRCGRGRGSGMRRGAGPGRRGRAAPAPLVRDKAAGPERCPRGPVGPERARPRTWPR